MLTSCQQPQQSNASANASCGDSACLGIAYVNTDSLINNYDYAVKMNETLNSKAESARADFNQKAKVFQQDLNEFQRKVQNNGFLSMDRAQKEQARLQKQEQDLQDLNQRLSAELMQEQGRLSAELHDTIVNYLKEFGEGRYSLILSNTMGDNVLYSAPGVDVTAEVLEALNARYNAATK